MNHVIHQSVRARSLLGSAVCLALSMMMCGCGTSAPVLSVTPVQSQQKYFERFTRAYLRRDAAGDYEVVLIDDPIDAADSGDSGQPLSQLAAPPIRQVLHIRLLWRPQPGAKGDSPAATNASLHWYVLGSTTVEGTSLIHYAGTAFVAISPNGPGGEVTIHNGLLKLVELHGELVDPLKTFRIDGKFDAVANDTRLAEVLADVKAVTAEAKTSQARNGTDAPGRSLMGP